MARDPWTRIARQLTKLTRGAVARADRSHNRSVDAESQAQAVQERKDRLSTLKAHAYERGRVRGAKEAERSAKVKPGA